MEDILGLKSLTLLDGKKHTCGYSTESLNS